MDCRGENAGTAIGSNAGSATDCRALFACAHHTSKALSHMWYDRVLLTAGWQTVNLDRGSNDPKHPSDRWWTRQGTRPVKMRREAYAETPKDSRPPKPEWMVQLEQQPHSSRRSSSSSSNTLRPRMGGSSAPSAWRTCVGRLRRSGSRCPVHTSSMQRALSRGCALSRTAPSAKRLLSSALPTLSYILVLIRVIPPPRSPAC